MRPGAFGRQRRACPSWNRSRIHLSSTFREGSESLVLNAKPIHPDPLPRGEGTAGGRFGCPGRFIECFVTRS